MAQKKYTHGVCSSCGSPLEQLESEDDLVIKFRCSLCSRRWDFHVDEDGYLIKADVTEGDAEADNP